MTIEFLLALVAFVLAVIAAASAVDAHWQLADAREANDRLADRLTELGRDLHDVRRRQAGRAVVRWHDWHDDLETRITHAND